jgi:hypothetical protein
LISLYDESQSKTDVDMIYVVLSGSLAVQKNESEAI